MQQIHTSDPNSLTLVYIAFKNDMQQMREIIAVGREPSGFSVHRFVSRARINFTLRAHTIAALRALTGQLALHRYY